MQCATDGCTLPPSGKSKYCAEHKEIARQKWLANVRASGEEKQSRDAKWQALWDAAHAAGMAAGNAVTPNPMIVVERANPLDDRSPVVRQYAPVMDGVCGFAWVVVCPGNHSFCHWAKKHQQARSEYGGGVCVKWVFEFNQSMTRKEAYARAFAQVLREAGIEWAYSNSRMD